jgi:co-chaperonin GroES (HSP10)
MNIKLIKPYKNYVLVRLIRKEDNSSIIIPEGVKKDKPTQGEVISIGKEVKQVKSGDIIAFNYAKSRFFEGEGELDANIAKRILIKEEDIYFKYE